jgi:ankyrin repeat protein
MKTPCLILVLTLPLFTNGFAADESSLLLQKALFEEEANHNLEAAIKAYEAVVAQTDDQRKLAATAVFRLGECYRKLGRTNDAVLQYQRVLGQFGDQTNLVSLSRQNLAGLGVEPEQERPRGKGMLGLTAPELLQLYAAQNAADRKAAPTAAEVEAQRLLVERLQLEIRAAEADLARQKELIRQELVPVNSAAAIEARLLDLRRQLVLAEAQSGAAVSAPTRNLALPPEAREKLRKLLLEEMKIAEQLLAEVNKSIQVGTRPPGDAIRFERDLLGLQRELLAVDGLTTRAEREQWRNSLLKEIGLAEKTVQSERQQVDVGKSTPTELARLQREVLAFKRELVEFDAMPSANASARASAESAFPPKIDPEEAEISRIKTLLKDSPDLINAKGSQTGLGGVPNAGRTMLYQAVLAGWPRVVEFLLANGADVNAQNPSSRGGNNLDTALHAAVAGGNKAMVKLLIDNGATVDARDGSNQTPLYVAAGRGFKAIAELLLDARAAVDAKAYDGTTPLHEAVRQGFRSVVELLVARGADVNAQGVTSDSWDNTRQTGLQGTPLHYAVTLNKPAMTELLLASKADPNARNKSGHTPLYYALSSGTNVMAMLLKAGANVNDKVPSGRHASWTPLHYFVANGWVEGAAMLLAAGADPNAVLSTGYDEKNCSSLILAAAQSRPEMIDLLLANKADPNLKTAAGNAPLNRAVQSNDSERRLAMARSLVHAGADVNALDSNGELPLIRAVRVGDKELAALLLQNKADPNVRSNDGYTALHLAIGYQKPKELIELLLAFKADPNAPDRQGRTALDYVKTGVNFPGGGLQLAPIPGQSSSAAAPMAKRATELITLLRASGGLDYAPRPDQITLTRRSSGASRAMFQKGTNDYNEFTLYEILAARGWGLPSSSEWVFPDFERVTISRVNDKTGAMEEIRADVRDAAKGDCSNNMALRWGDLVNIPESEHGLNAQWHGLPFDFIEGIAKCIQRTVTVTVKGQSRKLQLAPEYREAAVSASSGKGTAYVFTRVEFWLKPVLRGSGLLLTSSDLSRVKVRRTDRSDHSPYRGKMQEWTLDLEKLAAPNDLWLRDGDEIEVLEK